MSPEKLMRDEIDMALPDRSRFSLLSVSVMVSVEEIIPTRIM